MTPPPSQRPAAKKSAKKVDKTSAGATATPKAKPPAKKATKKATKATKPAAKKAAGKTAASSAKDGTKKAAKKSTKTATSPSSGRQQTLTAETPLQCAARTVKGTQCRLKPQEGTLFCARHKDAEAPVASPTATPDPAATLPHEASVEAMSLPEIEAEAAVAKGDDRPAETQKGTRRAKPAVRRTKADDGAAPRSPGATEGDKTDDEEPTTGDEDFVLYGSVYSTTLEASPYDTDADVSHGDDDVELVDENEMGRRQRGPGGRPQQGRGRGPPRDGQRPPDRPAMSQEEAEAKALEVLGPKPTIAPEEDLDDELGAYEARFKAEVNRLLGRQRRKRGRRGGRRRGGDQRQGGGGGGGSGPRRGGGGRGRGRRGGGGGSSGGSSGGSGGGGRSRGGGGAPKNVGRDSPLANKRPSQGPKRGVRPRRRRDPDV